VLISAARNPVPTSVFALHAQALPVFAATGPSHFLLCAGIALRSVVT
jgi:hypothetical protein